MGSVQVGCLYSPLRKGNLLNINPMNSYVCLCFLLIANGVDHRFCQHHQPSSVPSVTNHATALQQKAEENKERTLDKQALAEYVDKQGHYDDNLCNVFRSGINIKSKISSYGFLATFLNCSVLVGFTEQPCSEGSSSQHFISQRCEFRIVRFFYPISASCSSSHLDNQEVRSPSSCDVL